MGPRSWAVLGGHLLRATCPRLSSTPKNSVRDYLSVPHTIPASDATVQFILVVRCLPRVLSRGCSVVVVPCRAVPCRAAPCRAVPCRAVPRRAQHVVIFDQRTYSHCNRLVPQRAQLILIFDCVAALAMRWCASHSCKRMFAHIRTIVRNIS